MSAASSPPATTPSPWRVAGFLSVAAALNYADRAVFSVVMPAIRTEFLLSDVALGWLGAVFLWSYALMSPLAGGLADRFSRSTIVRISLAGWSLVTTMTGAVQGWAALVALRIALGVAESLYLPSAIALIADHHGARTRARAVSVHIVGMNVGVVLGGALAGAIAERFGWRSSFWTLGLVGLALAASTRSFLADTTAVATGSARAFSTKAAVAFLLRTPLFHLLLFVAMLAGVAVWIFFNWFPLYLRERHTLSLGAAGLAAMGMLQVASVLGLVAGGWLSDRAASGDPRRRLLVFAGGYLLAAPCLLAFTVTPGLVVVGAAVSLFSFLRAAAAVNELPVLCDVVPAQFRSTAVGIMNTAATAAGGLGVLAAAFLKARFGLETVFAGLSVVFVLAAVTLAGAYRMFVPAGLTPAQPAAAKNPDDAALEIAADQS